MQQTTTQDTTTQAMTEVALALAMAFFALLIVALISFAAPSAPENVEVAPSLPDAEKVKLADKPETDIKQKSSSNNQFAIWYQNQLFDLTLNTTSFRGFKQNEPLVIAVQASMPFSQLMQLKQKINHPNLSITTLDNEWLDKLEQLK